MLDRFTEFKGSYKDQKLAKHIQEEYLIKGKNLFDVRYMTFKYKTPCSVYNANNIVNSLFGTVKFDYDDNENEVSEEEFLEHYKFGVYPNVRSWIGHIYEATGKLLTREKLFHYVLRN